MLCSTVRIIWATGGSERRVAHRAVSLCFFREVCGAVSSASVLLRGLFYLHGRQHRAYWKMRVLRRGDVKLQEADVAPAVLFPARMSATLQHCASTVQALGGWRSAGLVCSLPNQSYILGERLRRIGSDGGSRGSSTHTSYPMPISL